MRRVPHLGLSTLILLVSSFRINLAPSSPLGIYWLLPLSYPSRGAFVVVCPPARIAAFGLARGYLRPGFCPQGCMPLLKTVIALPGDQVVASEDGIAVNGRPSAHSKPRSSDSRSRPIEPMPPACYTVLPGTLWVLGSRGDSWDSRYYGALPASGLLGVAKPVWTL
jgi:conjugative transfer signal peptidase TraF